MSVMNKTRIAAIVTAAMAIVLALVVFPATGEDGHHTDAQPEAVDADFSGCSSEMIFDMQVTNEDRAAPLEHMSSTRSVLENQARVRTDRIVRAQDRAAQEGRTDLGWETAKDDAIRAFFEAAAERGDEADASLSRGGEHTILIEDSDGPSGRVILVRQGEAYVPVSATIEMPAEICTAAESMGSTNRD